MKQSGITFAAAAGLALCCGAPALLASGALAAMAGAIARRWPLVAVGGTLLVYAASRIYRRAKAIQASGLIEKRPR